MPTSAFFCWSSKASAISTGSTSQENEDSWLRTGFPAFSPHTNLHRSDAICCTKFLMLWDLWWLCGIVERSCCHRRRRNISFTLCRDATLVSKEYKVGLFQQWYLKKKIFIQTPLSQVKWEHDTVLSTEVFCFFHTCISQYLFGYDQVLRFHLSHPHSVTKRKQCFLPPSNLCSTS